MRWGNARMRLFAWVAVGPGCIPAKGLKACGAGRLIGLLLATSVATAAGAGASPVAAAIGGASVTGQDAAAALTGLQEGNRYNAIANLVRTGQLRLPVSASDAAQILAGTTQGARAASIAELARVLKDDLTGQEATAVLGSATDLTDGNRYNAIAALARAKRFGPSLGGDAELALNGARQGSRAAAIGELAPYLRTDMRGPQVAAILGGGQILSEGNRYNAIAALARAGRMPKALTGAEAEPILAGASQGARASSISEMAPYFKDDLTGQETATMLGPAAVLSEGNRYNAITALARAKRFGPSIGGDAGLALDGATQGSRAAAIGEMGPYLRTDMRGQHVAAILGGEQVLSEGNRYNAIAALARAGRIPRALTAAEAELILAGATQGSRAAAISEVARYFVAGLSGDEVAAILGRNGETTEGNRYNAIAALARAGKLRAGLSGQELATVLQGMSDSSRSAAIREVASATARQIAVEPTASGTSPPKSQVPSTGEQDAGPSSPDPVLGSASLPTSTAGSTPPVLSKSIKDLPKLPLSDLRLSEYVYQFALLSQAVYQVSEIRKVDVPTRSGTETWELIGVPAIIAKGTDGLAWGFKAGVYMNRKGSTNRSVWRCAIVFAGTDDLIDMGVDIAQALGGQPPDYRVAAAFADNAIKGLCKGITTVFTGHSLGGGFAQYAYVRTGERYATFSFNTAGLAATNLDFQAANFRSGNVVNFIAQGYDPYSGRLMGRDVVSLSGVTLGRELLVPVYTWAPYTHKVAVLIEGLGIQRGYCLADPACK